MSCLYGKSRFMHPGDERSVDEKSIDDSVDEVEVLEEEAGWKIGRLKTGKQTC